VNAFIHIMIVAVMLSGTMVQWGYAPKLVKYTPELLSAIALLVVLVQGARSRFQDVRPAYFFAFGAVLLIILSGILANGVSSGALFGGIRTYLRALPFFLLPLVYTFTERQVRSQLLLVLLLCLPQLPIAISQRANAMAFGNPSGDEVAGTLLGSGLLSIFLICAACVLTAAFMRKRIRLAVFLPLFLLVLAPTTINETKATLAFAPFGLLATVVVCAPRGARMKNAVVGTVLLAIFAAVFIPIYDYYISKTQYGVPIMEFFSDQNRLDRYMSQNAGLGRRDLAKVGRKDALMVPLKEMAKEPTHFAFGLGIGNASHSALGPQFSGEHFAKFEPFLQSSATIFILEIGMLGLALSLIIQYPIYRDSRVVGDVDDGVIGTLAVGWVGVSAVIFIADFYATIDGSEAISYLYWFFSGVVAAHRVRLGRVPAVELRADEQQNHAGLVRPARAISH
jgi:hypothetical protein